MHHIYGPAIHLSQVPNSDAYIHIHGIYPSLAWPTGPAIRGDFVIVDFRACLPVEAVSAVSSDLISNVLTWWTNNDCSKAQSVCLPISFFTFNGRVFPPAVGSSPAFP